MSNSASSQGQLQRAGVQRFALNREYGVKGMKWGSKKDEETDKRVADAISQAKSMEELETAKRLERVKSQAEKQGSYSEGHATKLENLAGDHNDKAVSAERAGRDSRAHWGLAGDLIRASDSITGRNRMRDSSRIRESSHSSFLEQGKDENKDGKKNRVYLCTIIEEGLGNSKDKNYYSADALKNGTKVFDSAKAFADHPDAISEKTLPERSMKDLVGWYSDCFTDQNPSTGKVRLRGKLHFFPTAKWLTDMIDTILNDPTVKNLFGISINAVGKTRPATMNGEEVNYVEEFQRVDSADVVTEPAARGKFDKMLESRRSVAKGHSGKVSLSMRASKSRRAREAAVLSPEKAKEVADSLVSAYHSDNPDELKQASYEAAKELYAVSSISGKGPGQVNEEQYSNINPSGGPDDMSKKKVKASTGRRGFIKKRKRIQAAAGTGPDSEDTGEPEPSDVDDRLEEADVEDEEGRGDLGSQADYGGGGKYRKVKAARTREDEDEDEGFEDEDEGFEDEDEDETDGIGAGAVPHAGSGVAAPPGGGAPGSSRAIASEADDEDEDGDDDDGDEDDMDDMDESLEDEGLEDEDEDEHDMMRPGTVAESRRRRTHEADGIGKKTGILGRPGHSSLPKHADPTKGYEDTDEDFGAEDDSTSGTGKSYKMKTSKYRRNRAARRVAKEANRRIERLEDTIRRLRESLRHSGLKIERYRGKIRFIESQGRAIRILREAVKNEILPVGYAKSLAPKLFGLSEKEQVREVQSHARLLESATEGTLARLTESVDGNGARGGVASYLGPAGADNSELVDGLAELGVPMKEEK